jgi:hypothetical protein
MVRSHALYPIELRAHPVEIASSDYNGNRIVSPNRIVRPHSHFAPNPALAVEIGGLSEIEETTTLVN